MSAGTPKLEEARIAAKAITLAIREFEAAELNLRDVARTISQNFCFFNSGGGYLADARKVKAEIRDYLFRLEFEGEEET